MIPQCGSESARTDTFLDIPLAIRPFGSKQALGSVVSCALHPPTWLTDLTCLITCSCTWPGGTASTEQILLGVGYY